ncbi:AraC family transcriptional activator of mtrCDE [Mucilaginibacter terrae]|uniref:AraC family transcriptional activator of mtrCDE n=2 Tax=Mucilaginibacter terrae TaxID=1955052 RepID=A0ABU3H0A4_9SPHI|nr:AraC family transcriptional activator of mtrCDE [Mucilaginibacter terrae]
MNQVTLQQGVSRELAAFSHILEITLVKNTTIQLNSFSKRSMDCICMYYITEGKFDWVINGKACTVYPGDMAILLPGQCIAGENDILNIGSYYVIKLAVSPAGKALLGKWSLLTQKEKSSVDRILCHNRNYSAVNLREAHAIIQSLIAELKNEEVGAITMVNYMLDQLIVLTCRQLIRQSNLRRDFPQTFLNLEQMLRKDLSHQWTVEEMAVLTGMGTTAFTEKVKSFSGFSPLNYLINIRISEAIKMLKRGDANATEIAYATGFYSSQHFSTTFKKLTGYTPSEFRKNNQAE